MYRKNSTHYSVHISTIQCRDVQHGAQMEICTTQCTGVNMHNTVRIRILHIHTTQYTCLVHDYNATQLDTNKYSHNLLYTDKHNSHHIHLSDLPSTTMASYGLNMMDWVDMIALAASINEERMSFPLGTKLFTSADTVTVSPLKLMATA